MGRAPALLSFAVFAACALGACSGGEAEEDQIVVWAGQAQSAAVQAAAERFEADTGTHVVLVEKAADAIERDLAAQGGQADGPDLVAGSHEWLDGFAEDGLVAPFDLGAAADGFAPIALQAFSRAGQTYAVPFSYSNIALIRNVDLAPEAPATWDEAVAAGQAAGAQYPVLVQTSDAGDPYTYYPFQASFGAPVFTTGPDGAYTDELGLGGPGGEAFAAWLAAEGAAGRLDRNITYAIAVSLFQQGRSPFVIGGPWMTDSFKAAGLANLSVDPIPAPGPEAATPFVTVQGFYAVQASAQRETAQRFALDYLGSEETQTALYETTGATPALSAAAAQAAAADPLAAGFAALGAGGALTPSDKAMVPVYASWGPAEAAIITGSKPPADAWRQMAADIEAAIG
ncbi:MAG: extracellular solute-binding protein [Propionibacteriaceae bacterium]|nr:extracellular solute-binding protein [Propionibacteriaceae bacterium]